jgi:hypothetical protein
MLAAKIFLLRFCYKIKKHFPNNFDNQYEFYDTPAEEAIGEVLKSYYFSTTLDNPKKEYSSRDFIYEYEAKMSINLLQVPDLNNVPMGHCLLETKFLQFMNKYYPNHFIDCGAVNHLTYDGGPDIEWTYTTIEIGRDDNFYRIVLVNWSGYENTWNFESLGWTKDFCIKELTKFANKHKRSTPSYSLSQCKSPCVFLERKSSQKNARNKLSIIVFPEAVNLILQALIPKA